MLQRIRREATRVVASLQPTAPWIPVVSLLGASAAAVYLSALHLLRDVLGPGSHTALAQAAILAATGLAVGLLIRAIGSTGDVELLVDNIHLLGRAPEYRTLRSLIPASLLCIAAGGAAGPEAPLVQTTGSIGTWVASRRGLSRRDVRILTITGMASGFTVLFGAPLGGAIFSLEILHRRGLEYHEALVPALIGSLVGFAVFTFFTGIGLTPVWHLPVATAITRRDLWLALAVGVLCAAGAAAFTATVVALRRCFSIAPQWIRPMIGGIILAALAVWSPFALTFGEEQFGHAVILGSGGALAVAALAKFLGTSVTVSSGWRGGFIIPLFFMGAMLGLLAQNIVPASSPVVLVAAFMAALNTGVTKTPVGSTLVVTRMAGLALLPTTLLAAVVTLMLSGGFGLIETQRRRSASVRDASDSTTDSELPVGD